MQLLLKADPRHGQALPTGSALAAVLQRLRRRQGQAVLAAIRRDGEDARVAGVLAVWVQPTIDAARPLILRYTVEGGKAAAARLRRRLAREGQRRSFARKDGTSPSPISVAFDLFNPAVSAAVEQAAFAFSTSTLATAAAETEDALRRARAAIAAGLERGDALDQLTRDVQAIFNDPRRARTIAATEASRATHAGQLLMAQQSGVVTGLEWLASSDCCPACEALSGKRVALGESFTAVTGGPYGSTPHPPLHPNCRCSVLETLTPVAGHPGDAGRVPEARPKPPPYQRPDLATVEVVAGQRASAEFEKIFGRPPTREDYLSAVGAQEGVLVQVEAERDGVSITANGDTYESSRTLGVDENGTRYVYNETLIVYETGTGLGTRVLADQVVGLTRLGVPEIRTLAAGSAESAAVGGMNGYYTWPRLGYNAPLSAAPLTVPLPADLADAADLLDLMGRPGGAEWWKANGKTTEMTFDTRPGSASRRVLARYMDARGVPMPPELRLDLDATGPLRRGIKQAAAKGPPRPPEKRGGERPDLSAEEQAILDRVWEEEARRRAALRGSRPT